MKDNKEVFMYVLGGFVVFGAMAIVIVAMLSPIPEANHDAVMLSIGLFMGMAGSVVGYFYGSSKSSADKTDVMAATAGKLAADKTDADIKTAEKVQ